MSDDEKTEIRVKVFETDEEKLLLVLPGEGWTYEEAKVAKQVSEGMSPVAIEQSLLEADPDAWMAVLRVSYMRAGRDFPATRVHSLNILELANAVTAAVKEAVSSRPPTKQNGSDPSEPAVTPAPEPAPPTPS